MARRRFDRHPSRVPRDAAPEPAAHRRWRPRARVGTIATSLASAILMLVLTSGGALASTVVTPKCDSVNLRTGPSTTYTKKTSVNTGTKLTVVATVVKSLLAPYR